MKRLVSLVTGLVSHVTKSHKELKHMPAKLAKLIVAYQPANKLSPDKVGHVETCAVVGPRVRRKRGRVFAISGAACWLQVGPVKEGCRSERGTAPAEVAPLPLHLPLTNPSSPRAQPGPPANPLRGALQRYCSTDMRHTPTQVLAPNIKKEYYRTCTLLFCGRAYPTMHTLAAAAAGVHGYSTVGGLLAGAHVAACRAGDDQAGDQSVWLCCGDCCCLGATADTYIMRHHTADWSPLGAQGKACMSRGGAWGEGGGYTGRMHCVGPSPRRAL